MPNYRRAFHPGGTFFLTLVTQNRAPIFDNNHTRSLLRRALENARRHHPFTLDAIVCLPQHLHMLITLPPTETDFSTRLNNLKSTFTRAYLAQGGKEQPRSNSRVRQRSRAVWQKRFWEHTIRDSDDLRLHYDYIHYNPVKHDHVKCPHPGRTLRSTDSLPKTNTTQIGAANAKATPRHPHQPISKQSPA